MTKETLRMQMLAGIITEGQYKEKLNEEKSWDDVDKEIADEEAKELETASTFSNTTQGKNAIRIIKDLISKPYGYSELDDVLQILNLDRQNFIYAAKAAGMDFGTDGAGIHIRDDNYQDQDVSINQIGGEWYVG
jgi:hypothetical protein